MRISFTVLLGCLVTLLVFPNFLEVKHQGLIIVFLLTVVMLVFLHLVKQKRWEFFIGSILALLAVCSNVLHFIYQGVNWWGWVLIFNVLFYGFLVFELLRYIVHRKVVDHNILSAAASVYLLLGLVWCYTYALLDFYIPGSILPQLDGNFYHSFSKYLYFSFVTLTTLGYGDIVPITKAAQNWVVMEAIVGQFYLTVLIARLVGLYKSPSDLEK